jgi:hypothetical protein
MYALVHVNHILHKICYGKVSPIYHYDILHKIGCGKVSPRYHNDILQ